MSMNKLFINKENWVPVQRNFQLCRLSHFLIRVGKKESNQEWMS